MGLFLLGIVLNNLDNSSLLFGDLNKCLPCDTQYPDLHPGTKHVDIFT